MTDDGLAGGGPVQRAIGAPRVGPDRSGKVGAADCARPSRIRTANRGGAGARSIETSLSGGTCALGRTVCRRRGRLVVSIERGMTRDQVVDLLGPPISTLSEDEFRAAYRGVTDFSVPQRRGVLDRLRRRPQPRSEPVSWFYLGFPEGKSTLIKFRHGIVEDVHSQPFERVQTRPRHEWARELVVAHIGRVGARDHRITARPAWQRLTSAEVLDFTLDAGDNAYPPVPGRIGGNTRRFGELTVLVSMFNASGPQQVRSLLTGGYMSHLFWLLDEFGVRLGESDVAHWILCRENANGDGAVHLSYLPAETEGMSALLPVDLLSGKERRRYLR
jgi:hypothetical protein